MSICIENKYFSGQGSLLVASRDQNGKPTGLRSIGNTPAVNIKTAIQNFEHKESCTGSRGIDYTKVTETGVDIDFTMENFSRENLAMAWFGTASKLQTGTQTAYPVNIYKDAWSPLQHIKVSNVVVKSADGATTYVAGTDYTLNDDSGSIMGHHADFDNPAGAACIVDYTYAAQEVIEAFTSSSLPDQWFRFVGLNTADKNQTPVILDFYKVNPKPLADFALLNDELASGEISAKVLSDPLRTTGSKFYTVKRV